MRCLWLARSVPASLTDGANIATAKMAGALAGAGVEVVFMGLKDPDDRPSPDLSQLDPKVDWRFVDGPPRQALAALFSPRPLVAARFGTRAYRAAVEKALTEPWDAVVLDQYAMVWVMAPARRACTAAGRKAVVLHYAHDFETEVTAQIARDYAGDPLRKVLLWANAVKTRKAEQALARGCDAVITLTHEDAASFRGFRSDLEAIVCPPGFDGVRTAPFSNRGAARKVCIVGSYRWIAKQMNLERFIAAADPIFAEAGIGLEVMGDAPADFADHLAARCRATRFLGFVADLNAAMAACRMGLLVEQTGGGFKLKTLDYVFGRLPVAALAGSFRGLPPEIAGTFFVEPDPEALARTVVRHIDDLEGLEARRDRAFDAATELFDWAQDGRRIAAGIEALARRAEVSRTPA